MAASVGVVGEQFVQKSNLVHPFGGLSMPDAQDLAQFGG
jgi:hypothetical protein